MHAIKLGTILNASKAIKVKLIRLKPLSME